MEGRGQGIPDRFAIDESRGSGDILTFEILLLTRSFHEEENLFTTHIEC